SSPRPPACSRTRLLRLAVVCRHRLTRRSEERMATEGSTEALEQQLESMLDIENSPPPDDFRKQALVQDESMYEEAAKDPEAFWKRQAGGLMGWVGEALPTRGESHTPS